MKKIILFFTAASFFFSFSSAFSSDFYSNPYWNTGKAEYQLYEARIKKYGIMRTAEVKIIMVKEPFDMEKIVKTRREKNADDVIKMNYIQVIPTGVYNYYQTASIFFHRKTGTVMKYTMSSQDGCGNTFMEYLLKDTRHEFKFYSYFDDEGDKEISIERGNFFFYDSLPISLRPMLNGTGLHKIMLARSFISNRTEPVKIEEAEVIIKQIRTISIKGKAYTPVYKAVVKCLDKTDTLYFETVFPYRLLKWDKNSGDSLTLKGSKFFYYWEYTKPENADFLMQQQ
ncbi:MAG: hypothetical protein JRF40_05955 [Deltaproteobacteria bacterium]|nr:hypothetical protein [Deltaproteobacteria bacterium]MBW2219019.1 hypothetical protein [Deltaproteobacteria bacterium]